MDPHEVLQASIRLMAEDLRSARLASAITSARAAKRAHLSPSRYRALESGNVLRTRHNAAELVTVARRLGLQSLRAAYVDETDQYMKIDLSDPDRATVYVDALESDFAGLKAQGHFVTPSLVMSLLDRIGRASVLDSRKPTDKQIAELWVAALFTLGLSDDSAYYVRPVREDPPDVEVLVVDRADGRLSAIRVEVAQCTRHSQSVFEVIGKKLLKRYHDGTVIVVLVEQSLDIAAGEMFDFIRSNNLQNHRVYIVGGGFKPQSIRIVPCFEVPEPGTDEMAILNMDVRVDEASKGFLGYEGVVYRPPRNSSIQYPLPVYVKKVTLTR